MSTLGIAVCAALLIVASCGPMGPAKPDSTRVTAALRACAPEGWRVAEFPPGLRDTGMWQVFLTDPEHSDRSVGQIFLISPAQAQNAPDPSAAGWSSMTNWWRAEAHEDVSVAFTDGTSGSQYRSNARTEVTTAFAGEGGRWFVYGSPDDPYDAVIRCIQPRLRAL